MVSIAGAGGYVPLYRIERDAIARQHGGSASGHLAVPGRDETLVTMACEAAGTALARTDIDGLDLDAVFAASVTDPFAEHGIAAHVAYRFGATGDVRTADFRGTPRAATDAFASARRVVQATGGAALVVGTDAMPVEPGHDDEPYSGAGAGAIIMVGDAETESDGTATADGTLVHGVGQHTSGFVERHREHGAPAESGDQRFEGVRGFGAAVQEAVGRVLGDVPATPSSAVVSAPDPRMVRGAIGEFPGDIEHVSTFDRVGYAGTASFYLDLAHLLETAVPDTTALAVAYGSGGADAVAVTTGAHDPAGERTVADQLDARQDITYAQHLQYRERPEYKGVSAE